MWCFFFCKQSDQLCFAISLTCVVDPGLTDPESERWRRELRHSAGLDVQTPVTFSDIGQFEKILGCKTGLLQNRSQPLILRQTSQMVQIPCF